jgi:predicted negative regulator of RcsB-dependent stress response
MKNMMITGTGLIFLFFTISACFARDPDTKSGDSSIQVLTKEDKTRFIKNATDLLNDNYVFPEIALKIGDYLSQRLEAGAYDTTVDPKIFTKMMTADMQSVSHDKHMRVRLAPPPLAGADPDDPVLDAILEQQNLKEWNNAFIKTEILEGNIGYIDLRGFVPLAVGKETATAAMKFLSNAYVIIFDLRKNGGGNPDLIQYICSYFFDQPTHLNSLYWRKGDRTQEFWTYDQVEGKKMVDIPLYILTSNRTFSGGEEFCYNMQTRKRAVLVGEVTGGGANPGGMFPVCKDLVMFIPTGRAINPVTGTNWEGTGVKPDIEVPADKALETALEKASVDAKQYRERKLDATIGAYKESRAKLDQAGQLMDQGKSSEAESSLGEALGNGVRNGIFGEDIINDLGYQYLNQDKVNMAVAVFRYNVKTYPGSANAYDSLGEACLKQGDKKQAAENYKKSLQLNPANDNAAKMLRDMGEK